MPAPTMVPTPIERAAGNPKVRSSLPPVESRPPGVVLCSAICAKTAASLASYGKVARLPGCESTQHIKDQILARGLDQARRNGGTESRFRSKQPPVSAMESRPADAPVRRRRCDEPPGCVHWPIRPVAARPGRTIRQQNLRAPSIHRLSIAQFGLSRARQRATPSFHRQATLRAGRSRCATGASKFPTGLRVDRGRAAPAGHPAEPSPPNWEMKNPAQH